MNEEDSLLASTRTSRCWLPLLLLQFVHQGALAFGL